MAVALPFILAASAAVGAVSMMNKGAGGDINVAAPDQTLQQQSLAQQAVPTAQSVPGSDAEAVLSRMRARKAGALGVQEATSAGNLGAANTSKASPGVTPGGAGYTPNKKAVGQ